MKGRDGITILKRTLIIFAALPLFMISSCSDSEEEQTTTLIEQTTERIAQEAVDKIQTPIEKANLAKGLQERHNLGIQQATEQEPGRE